MARTELSAPRNLLPLIAGISVVHAWIAWKVMPLPSVMSVYVCWVLLSLRSSRTWHVYATAVAGTAMLLVQHACCHIFALTGLMYWVINLSIISTYWGVAFLGVDIVRRAREMVSITARASTLREQSELQRSLLDKLNLAVENADLWLWEASVEGQLLWEVRRPQDMTQLPLQPTQLQSLLTLTRGKPGESVTLEFQDHAPDGHERYWQSIIKLIGVQEKDSLRLMGITRDISNQVAQTEFLRHQAEQERKSNERLRLAARAGGLWVWERDPVTHQVIWDENRPVVHKMNKLSVGEIQEHLTDMLLPEDVTMIRQEVSEAVAAHKLGHALRYRTRNHGVIRHYHSEMHFDYDENGRNIRIIGVSRDITNEVHTNLMLQRQAEQERVMLDRLSTAARAARVHCWQIDFPGKTIVWSENPQAEFGAMADDASLEKITELRETRYEGDAIHQLRELGKELVRTHQQHAPARVFSLTLADGSVRHMRHHSCLFYDAKGSPTHLIGATVDITQELALTKQIEQQSNQLRETHARLERAINGTSDGLWEADIQSGKLWLSPRYAELIGYHPSECTTWTLADVDARIHPDDLPEVHFKRLQHHQFNVPFESTVRYLHKDGHYIWGNVRAALERDEAGRPLRASGLMRDVTVEHDAKEQLIKATEEAQEANRAKSAFLANMSHEIRTPMNGIIGMTGLLLDTELDHTQRDFAETIRNSADSLLGIINDILDFSKIEAGKLDIESLEMDLRNSVEDVGAMMGFQAASKHIELVVNVHPDTPEWIFGDPQRIRQCLINLTGNAIKFTSQGEVEVSVMPVLVNGSSMLRFTVRDTGIGMSEDTAARLFQPFVQADSSTTRKFGGTGLGLSIVKRLIDMMHGEVGVKSMPGQGSTFWFTLPMQVAPTPLGSAALKRARNNERILVVDDNATNRRVLELQLRHAGYLPILAGSGADALTLLHDAATPTAFDLIVTDFQMPDMDGGMFATHVHALRDFARMRIILLTSMDRQGDVQRFAEMGFAAYLTKPVRSRELYACIDRIMHSSSDSATLVTRNTLHESQSEGFIGHVLLVDDNVVNQKVATRFLERMGLTVTVASDGAEAVREYEEGDFALVFMDLQMPVMDGFQATRRIRDFEGWRPRTPIIALTANAIRGQMERCLAVGMDDFLSKPIQIDKLRDIVAKYCGRAITPKESITETTAMTLLETPAPGNAPIDLSGLLAMTEGDTDFLKELIVTYIDSAQTVCDEIRAAAAQDDRETLSRAAHKLKGASANTQLEALRQLAETLEKNGPAMDAAVLTQTIAELQRTLHLTIEALQAELKKHQSAA